jgi:SAM-dependent methyltransferase
MSFDELLQDGLTLAFSGWDFAAIGERWTSLQTGWDFADLARERFAGVQRLLDMDTGGGEFLASLAPLPPETYASESFLPNIAVARQRLEPLGVGVVSDYKDESLPFEPDFFELVLNRHGSFHAPELYRILRHGGIFLTQQVGGENNIRLNELLQDEVSYAYSNWTLEKNVHWLKEAGLRIVQAREETPQEVFYDVGAVVYYLRIISWQIADFCVEKYREKLQAVHALIQREGKLVTHGHRILVEALKE